MNSLWKKLWFSTVNDFAGVSNADADIFKIKFMARYVRGEGLGDMREEFRQELQ